MRHFLDASGQVMVVFGDAAQPPSTYWIPDEVAEAADLMHGEVLSEHATAAVKAGDWETLIAVLSDRESPAHVSPKGAVPDDDELAEWQSIEVGDELPIDALPPLGRWQYRVLALTELGGFATAKGTATRMQELLNVMGAEGWELVVANDRASRYLSGESMLLTLRRWVTTEDEFLQRAISEERLRRVAARSLDDDQASGPPR